MRRWLYLGLILLVLAALANQYRIRIRHQMADFEVYRTAAIRVMASEPLYRAADGHYQFKYLPAFAFAMTPFGAMNVALGKAVWFGLSVLWLGWLVTVSVRALPDRRLASSVLSIAGVVLMAKFYGHELTLGQANALLGAILISTLLALRGGRTTTAAVLVGIAVFVKPYAGIVWPWLAFARGRRVAAVTGVVIAAGVLLPAVRYGWDGNLDQLQAWWQTVSGSTGPNLLNVDNVSLTAMWTKWLGAGSATTALAGASSTVVILLLAIVFRRGRLVSQPAYLDLAALMIAIPLLSPQGWDYVLLLGTPAVLCVVDRWRTLQAFWQVLSAVALIAMSFTTFDLMGRVAYGHFMDWCGVTIAALAILATLAHIRWRQLC